jgi:aspartate kinase
MLVVKKFGGSSVADKEKIFCVAKRCIEDYEKGNQVVVVLSAMGKTTDGLIAKAYEMNPNPPKRELDMLLATGEQVSVAMMAMAMDSIGIPAVSFNAAQVKMHTTKAHGTAKLTRIDTERIQSELDDRKIVIITGFQGMNCNNDLTTLGRGGSDTTAVALAAALHADACEIYTDVEGVYTADPRIVKNARKLPEVSYAEMLEFASLGAKVLHNRSVEMAKRYGVQMVVRSSLNRAEGTIVKEETKLERMLVSGVAADKNVARISVMGVENAPGIAFRIFHLLAKYDINVDIIIQSIGREERKDISFTVAKTDMKQTMTLLRDNKDEITARDVTSEEDVAKVSIIGAGMTSNPGVAAKMFEALSNEKINIKMIATSEIRITVLVKEKDVDRAMQVVHDAYELAE